MPVNGGWHRRPLSWSSEDWTGREHAPAFKQALECLQRLVDIHAGQVGGVGIGEIDAQLDVVGIRRQRSIGEIADLEPVNAALERELADARPKRRRPTVEEMIAATERLWSEAGVRPPFPPVTKEEWDEINEIPGLAEDWD